MKVTVNGTQYDRLVGDCYTRIMNDPLVWDTGPEQLAVVGGHVTRADGVTLVGFYVFRDNALDSVGATQPTEALPHQLGEGHNLHTITTIGNPEGTYNESTGLNVRLSLGRCIDPPGVDAGMRYSLASATHRLSNDTVSIRRHKIATVNGSPSMSIVDGYLGINFAPWRTQTDEVLDYCGASR
jgi:hypothetical protein